MSRYPTLVRLTSCLLLACLLPLPVFAKKSEWNLPTGKFKGEPVEVLGPLALFRTSDVTSKIVPLGGWQPGDYKRFAAETAARPPRAAHWSDAKGDITRELLGNVQRLQNQQFVPVDFSAQPEPEALIVLFGSHNDAESWMMVSDLTALYQHLQHVYPGRIETVFYGVRHSASEHNRIATTTWMPWLVTNFASQSSLRTLAHFAPAEGPALLLISRDGVPLLSTAVTSRPAVHRFIDDVAKLLAFMDVSRPTAWRGIVEYQRIARLQTKGTTLPPELVGSPLRPEVLRKYGAARVEASLKVGANGAVTAASLLPTSVMPAELKPAIQQVLQQNLILLPAVAAGREVPGDLSLSIVVPPADRDRDAEAAWFSGVAARDLPIPSWLVLRPIRVTEQDFGDDHVNADGTVVRKAMTIVDGGVTRASQMNAFHTDWFADAGPDSVRPAEGDSVEIDGTRLRWERVKSDDGLVDFTKGIAAANYSIGYAWTEIEVPADTDAWLGLGSDDGVKIWLNGELVDDKWTRRYCRLDDDIVPLHLKQGKNRILIKIQNAVGDWAFISRLRTRG